MDTSSKKRKSLSQKLQAEDTLNLIRRSRINKDAVRLGMSADTESVTLPSNVIAYLEQILELITNEQPFEIISNAKLLTTQQAADFMNVSRPHVVKLMEAGKLPFRRVGKHRRVALSDLKHFYISQESRADKALKELVRQAQDLNFGY
jgi:excisionase family DNA binding protein